MVLIHKRVRVVRINNSFESHYSISGITVRKIGQDRKRAWCVGVLVPVSRDSRRSSKLFNILSITLMIASRGLSWTLSGKCLVHNKLKYLFHIWTKMYKEINQVNVKNKTHENKEMSPVYYQ